MESKTAEKFQEVIDMLIKDKATYKHTYLTQKAIASSNHSNILNSSLRAARIEASAGVDLTLSTIRQRYRALRRLKGSKKGKMALLMGNGPSSSMINWEEVCKFDEDIEIATVNFFELPDKSLLDKVKIFVCSDPNTLASDEYQSRPELARERRSLAEKLDALGDAYIFVPRFYYLGLRENTVLRTVSSKVIAFSDYESRLFGGISPLAPRSYCSMTLLKALSILGFLGYSKILLIGADNDYSKTLRIMPDNTVAVIDEHAHKLKQIVPVNQLSPLDHYVSLVKLERSWSRLSMLPVYNMDPMSFVTSFPKLNSSSKFFRLIQPLYQTQIETLDKLLA